MILHQNEQKLTQENVHTFLSYSQLGDSQLLESRKEQGGLETAFSLKKK